MKALGLAHWTGLRDLRVCSATSAFARRCIRTPYDRPMLRNVLHSKIHMAAVTAASPNYMGSLTIDADLLEQTGMRVSDAIDVANCRNGARFTTYIFRGEPGSGTIQVNGAAAHLVEVGDKLIIMHYALMDDAEYKAHRPRVLIMGEGNRVVETMRYEPGGT